MIQKSVQIKLEGGLEARPVAMLVQVASQYDSSVYIESANKKVNAKSIMGMMGLGLNRDEAVTVIADGNDEEAAVAGIEKFLGGKISLPPFCTYVKMISPFTISLAQALMLPSRPVHSKAFFPLGVLLCPVPVSCPL